MDLERLENLLKSCVDLPNTVPNNWINVVTITSDDQPEISNSDCDAHKFQLLYYLYVLKKYAHINAKGVLNYPLLKKTVRVELTTENEKEIQQVIKGVEQITSLKKSPRAEWKSYCKSCAYIELCWG